MENNQKFKIVTKLRKYTVTKKIYPVALERKNWDKFGKAAISNENVTTVSEEDVFMDFGPFTKEEETKKEETKKEETKKESVISNEEQNRLLIMDGNTDKSIC